MKKLIFLIGILFHFTAGAQNFQFAFVTDIHISFSNPEAADDLQKTVNDINSLNNLDFVLLTGDITEMGTNEELLKASQLLNQLDIPFYIVPGNHDTGWSESGGVDFKRVFGDDKFVFEHQGYKFIGCASGPYVRMSDGHIPRDATVWLDKILAKTPKDQPIIFINHYPLDKSLDNWYEAVDRLKQYNTQFAICGHGHKNKSMDFEGIPGTMGRSNLRGNENTGGYNIVEISQDTAFFKERIPGSETRTAWRKIPLGKRTYSSGNYERPSYAVNDSFPNVQKRWDFHSNANVISTPVVVQDQVIFGNSVGKVEALNIRSGKSIWTFHTGGGIFSSPAAYKGSVIFGSGDGAIYSLNAKNGQLNWKTETGAAVLGSPIIGEEVAYIGGSDGQFRALDAETGEELWTFSGLEGPVVSKPLLMKDQVVFGAWDTYLYALDRESGHLNWRWNNGSRNRMLSPAMVTPASNKGVVYIVAPDRFLTAIDASSGRTLWRTNEATVRESMGISQDGSLIYGKTMNDYIVAFKTNRHKPELVWRVNSKFGYDHVPSMLIERDRHVFFGTRNGVVYGLDRNSKQVAWKYKIDNSMVNTVRVIGKHKLLASTMDGRVVFLSWTRNRRK